MSKLFLTILVIILVLPSAEIVFHQNGGWEPDRRLTRTQAASETSINFARSIAADETGRVHLAWREEQDGNPEIYYKRSPDGGVSWGPAIRLTNDSGWSANPSIAVSGATVVIVWMDYRTGAPQIWYKQSSDGGITWQPDAQVTSSPGGGSFPSLAVWGNARHVVYVDGRDGNAEVYYIRSLDAGANWSAPVMNADGAQPTRLTTTPPNGQFTWSLHPTWEPGDERIYYASKASGTSQMWGMFSNGLGKEQKTNGLGSGHPHANVPEFSRDGTLTFWAGIEGQYGEVWTVRIGSPAGPVRLTETSDPMNSDNPSWAPDGARLLFDSNQPSPNGGVNIWSMAPDGSNQNVLIPGAFGQTSWQPVFNANTNVTVANVSAASFISTSLAHESIVSAFGSGLATATLAAASTPLPTTLAGTTVKVRDSAGAERLAPLFFISPAQINYQVPAGTANGSATITITSGDGSVSTGVSQITLVAPGLFAADASGQGVAAALALRIKADGTQSYEPVARFDQAQNRFVAIPIDLGPDLGNASDQVFLILFGTGIRLRSSLSAVSAKLGGVDAQATFAGALNGFVGLDQVNARIPRSLIGRGEIDILMTVDGRAANTARVSIR